jgi:hypothetical protein
MKNQKITIYKSGSFGVQKYEGKLLDLGKKDYAQYKGAPFVDFIPARKRTGSRLIATFQPYLVVLLGVGHPEVPSPFGPTTVSNGLTTKMSKYSSFDERYKTDFDQDLDAYLETLPADQILMDVRHTKSHIKILDYKIQTENV